MSEPQRRARGPRPWPNRVKHMREEIEALAEHGRETAARGEALVDQATDALERVNPLVVMALLAKIGRVFADLKAVQADIERIAHAAQFGVVEPNEE